MFCLETNLMACIGVLTPCLEQISCPPTPKKKNSNPPSPHTIKLSQVPKCFTPLFDWKQTECEANAHTKNLNVVYLIKQWVFLMHVKYIKLVILKCKNTFYAPTKPPK